MSGAAEDIPLIDENQAALLGAILDQTLKPEESVAVAALIKFTTYATLVTAARNIRENVKSEYNDLIATGYNDGARVAADLIDPEVNSDEA